MRVNESSKLQKKSVLSLHLFLILAFLANVFVSHYVLPEFNSGQDFLFFSTWSLFSSGKQQTVNDITWDNGKTYFFRDYRSSALPSEFNLVTLFYLLNSNKMKRIKKDYATAIREYCNCKLIEMHELSGSMYDHIILKKKLKAYRKFEL